MVNHDRPENPATVERDSGDQVESGQHGVDVGQILGRRQHWSDAHHRPRHQVENARKREAGQGAGHSDQELSRRARRIAGDLCHPAKGKEANALHVDLKAPGYN